MVSWRNGSAYWWIMSSATESSCGTLIHLIGSDPALTSSRNASSRARGRGRSFCHMTSTRQRLRRCHKFLTPFSQKDSNSWPSLSCSPWTKAASENRRNNSTGFRRKKLWSLFVSILRAFPTRSTNGASIGAPQFRQRHAFYGMVTRDFWRVRTKMSRCGTESGRLGQC